jgi:hypothetical protein
MIAPERGLVNGIGSTSRALAGFFVRSRIFFHAACCAAGNESFQRFLRDPEQSPCGQSTTSRSDDHASQS